MKHYKATWLGWILPAIISSCTKASLLITVQSHWQNLPVADSSVQGDLPETRYDFIDQTHQVSLAVANNADELYCTIRFASEESKRQILRHGGTLWINTAGKCKKTQGIAYPLAAPPKGQLSDAPTGSDRQALLMINLIVPGETLIPHYTQGGIRTLVQDAGDGLVYQAVIPLTLLGIDETFLANPVHRLAVGYTSGKTAKSLSLPGRRHNSPLEVWMPVKLAGSSSP